MKKLWRKLFPRYKAYPCDRYDENFYRLTKRKCLFFWEYLSYIRIGYGEELKEAMTRAIAEYEIDKLHERDLKEKMKKKVYIS